MPRSFRTGIPVELNTEIEKTAKQLRKQAKLHREQLETPSTLSSPTPSTPIESTPPHSPNPQSPTEMAEQQPPPERTFRQWATHDVTQQPLCITYPTMANFELKSGLIHLLPTYRGAENEEPHKFLKEFHVVCIGMKPHNITEDQIKLRAFPFALQDSAKEWLYDLPPGSVTTWNDLARLFLDRYFPEMRASSLRREISGIKQAKREAFHVYWERFRKLCSRCPQHGISDHQLLQYFCEGLLPFERRLLNASSGGSITDKTPTQIRELVKTMAEESKHNFQDDEWYTDVPRGVNEAGTSHMESQIS